jgi:hypothetical protein
MSNNSNAFRISNEQLLLLNILNTMYNDNLRQINTIQALLNNLNNANNQIRNILIELLNVPPTNTSTSRRNGLNERRSRGNNERNYNSNRVFVDNVPYIIDSVTEYTIPRSVLTSARSNNSQLDTSGLINNFLNNFMQPVEVYPTQSQIEAATRRVRYCDIARPINTQCPISMDDFTDTDMVTVIRPCGHIFHTEHLLNWFSTNCRCPVCRFDIREYNANASTEFYNRTNQTSNTAQSSDQTQRTSTIDSSNNTDRNFINRMDSLNNEFMNSSLNAFSNLINDSYFNNANGLSDLSGNYTDNLNGSESLAFLLLNTMNRNRGL